MIRMIEEENAAEPRAALRRKLFIMRIMQILLIKFLVSPKKIYLLILCRTIHVEMSTAAREANTRKITTHSLSNILGFMLDLTLPLDLKRYYIRQKPLQVDSLSPKQFRKPLGGS